MQSQTVSGFGMGMVRPEEVAELADRVGGPVFVPGQSGYVEECVSYSPAHGAVLISTRRMTGVTIDAEKRLRGSNAGCAGNR